MCCFSQSVELVSDTNIFARLTGKPGRQYLVYSMTIKAAEDLAMILPLPVPSHTGEDAVRFINMERYPKFFDDMRKGFANWGRNKKELNLGVDSKAQLAVVDVGSFEASFVPTVKDFDRLDARFRLPEGVWDKLPLYKTYGFAVFKLKPGKKKIHPMAFDFPTARADQLFFPTVHIHDGEVHETADFDHSLYCQLGGLEARRALDWIESAQPAGMFLDKDRIGELVNADEHVYLRTMKGDLKNEDVWI